MQVPGNNRWPDYCKIAFTFTGQQFDCCRHLYHSAYIGKNYPMWTVDTGCEMYLFIYLFFIMFAFFRLTPRWQWKLKCAIVKRSRERELKVVGESLRNPGGSPTWPFQAQSGRCWWWWWWRGGFQTAEELKVPAEEKKAFIYLFDYLFIYLFIDWPVQSRGNHENIKRNSPCWLHSARVPLSWFCWPARCPTYCLRANVGPHEISRKDARGAAALVMKCTVSSSHR